MMINEVVIIVISIISIRKTKAAREWREGKGASLVRTKKGQPTPSSLFPKQGAAHAFFSFFQRKLGKIDHVFGIWIIFAFLRIPFSFI